MDTLENKLKIYRGDNFVVTNKISIRQPTLNEICEYGEIEYFNMVNAFCAVPIDFAYQLSEMGILFTEITEFELFALISRDYPVDKTKILFGNVDFSQMKMITDTESNEMFLISPNGVVINQYNYMIMIEALRLINNVPKTKLTTVKQGQEKWAIEEGKRDYERAKRKAMLGIGKNNSVLLPLISAMVNYSGFKYDLTTVWNLTVYQFLDCINRVQLYENSNHLYTGMYSGCIDMTKNKKLTKDLNWLKEI